MHAFGVRKNRQTQRPEGYDPHEIKKGIENRVENIEYFAKKRDPSNGKKIEKKVPK
jgi:hypothetical protein